MTSPSKKHKGRAAASTLVVCAAIAHGCIEAEEHTGSSSAQELGELSAAIQQGEEPYQQFIQHISSAFAQADDPNGDFFMTAFDTDAKPDLVYIKRRNTGTAKIEVHVCSGASNYQTSLQTSGSAIPQSESASGDFTLAHFVTGSKPDLVYIKRRNTASGKIELHAYSGASNYQTLLGIYPTGIPQAEDANGSFVLANIDGDILPDLVYIKRRNTASGKVEVRTYSGTSYFVLEIQNAQSAFSTADDANGDFSLANFDGDAKPDLIFIKRRNTATGTIEVFARSGASNYQTKLQAASTALLTANQANGDFALHRIDADGTLDLVFIKRRNVGTGKIEVHVLRG